MKIKIGCCGWGYFSSKNYFGENWKERFKSVLQAYASKFNIVEVNSTFYRIPKLLTAQKWREEVDEINKDFEFTIKLSQIITHEDQFSSKTSIWAFNQMKQIARALRSKILLFQSAAGFKPTKENLEKVKKFFKNIDREDFILVWEVRWQKDWTPEIVKKLFFDLNVCQCVDPFRQDCFFTKDLFYYRLHGLGKPSMYNYKFSDEELKRLAEKVRGTKKETYVLFNNTQMYEDALKFEKFLEEF
ncbi:MAG: DUF72 domain-containing protein [Candidatus Aenigmarchaeota archaeon]|nr:DUF72 domain-containing protein [Candidatus Aenigmarchaeota archaeon]